MEKWTDQDRKEMMEEFERQDAIITVAKLAIDCGCDDNGLLKAALKKKGYGSSLKYEAPS